MYRLALLIWLALGAVAQAQVPVIFPGPQGSQTLPLTATATGTTVAFSATLTGTAGKFTYICGFVLTSGGTTAATIGNATVTGTVSGTMNFSYVFPSTGQGILGVAFPSCIVASAPNTNIVVTLPSGGAGTVAAITSWGYLN
jgi:hypothetical protein